MNDGKFSTPVCGIVDHQSALMNTPIPRRSMGQAAFSNPRQAPGPRDAKPVKSLASSAVFNGATEIGIEHHGELYRLKITRQGKLILTK